MMDKALIERIQRSMFGAMLRTNLPLLVLLAVLVVASIWMAATGGDWSLVIFSTLLVIIVPFTLWRNTTKAVRRVPEGSWIAYAVTPDGTLHSSSASGTTTVNPGFVLRAAATRDCWLMALSSGLFIVAPRELIPDADAALLVRHLPGRLNPPPAAVTS